MGMRLCIKEKETGNMIFYGTKYIGYKDLTHSWCMHYVWYNLKDICEYSSKEYGNYTDYIWSIEIQNAIAYIGDFTGLMLITFIMLYLNDIQIPNDCAPFCELMDIVENIKSSGRYKDIFEVSLE